MTKFDQVPEEHELTRKQEELIPYLLSLPTIQAAACAAGVGDKTARRWLKLPHFQKAHKAAKQALFDESLSLLMDGADDAIKGIKAIAKDDEVQPQVRLRAYQIWLEQAIGLHKMSELEQKVAELEQFLQDRSA